MLLHFLKHPQKTGAICSSSQKLAQMMLQDIKLSQAKNIAEIGPGLGVFTREILRRKSSQASFFALEINSNLVKKLQHKFPEIKIYHKGAENILEVMQEEGIVSLDAIISGLPWSIFNQKQQDLLLEQIYQSLGNNGCFSTFAYIFPTPQAKKFRKKLFERFESVKVSKIVWKNFPPAVVYYCWK